jgi:hypothetical protein
MLLIVFATDQDIVRHFAKTMSNYIQVRTLLGLASPELLALPSDPSDAAWPISGVCVVCTFVDARPAFFFL